MRAARDPPQRPPNMGFCEFPLGRVEIARSWAEPTAFAVRIPAFAGMTWQRAGMAGGNRRRATLPQP